MVCGDGSRPKICSRLASPVARARADALSWNQSPEEVGSEDEEEDGGEYADEGGEGLCPTACELRRVALLSPRLRAFLRRSFRESPSPLWQSGFAFSSARAFPPSVQPNYSV